MSAARPMSEARKADRQAAGSLRFVAGTALAAVLLAGCANSTGAQRVASAASKSEGHSAREADRNVSRAEEAVAKQPGAAALRASLGQAYMRAGRFESAITAFNDAMELGDESPRTALSLALANAAIGRNDEAVTILDDWRGEVPAADIGLAYALSGQTARGTAILADAVRRGAEPQARQNFAYALALDGRWREARIMMSQDLAPDMINDRIGEWAALASENNPRLRVAVLISAPIRTDSGQPERLALAIPAGGQTAAENSGTPASEPASAPLAATPMLAVAEPVAAVPASAVEDQPAAQQFEAAFAEPGFVSVPVIQQIPASVAQAPRGAAMRTAFANANRQPAASRPVAGGGTYLVQLGSFTSEQSARRASGVYTSQNAALRGHKMVIIPVTVNGTNYWRVAAAGFDAGTARSMCGSIKARGGTCLAYANTRAPAPGDSSGGPQMARRR